mmetsp:Transcript_82485/g.163774  ORF Transcript_82485/g.163774 Transcript_82485/m.163774 type:complete len:735 (+) Transcript_82485:61-2265(+)|eukprot:CAMPEP_0172715086 /NCGR_PEP_ID=MMETSP1074-20121228/67342_1 /TAXON_ID=2916 /ORGANISM="Ceratium fusus, Strain PA161109" /LENGTH=734 /DNA_ID=CAMNT_0013539625 /DNA_START=59 /DNA_END=2263 /DNA_ORIENTATION=+
MAYNFATVAYQALMEPAPGIDTDALRAEVSQRVARFDPKAWHEVPVATMLRGEPLCAEGDVNTETVDAFGKPNGKQVLSGPRAVDEVAAHVLNFRVAPGTEDIRQAVRRIEDTFFMGPFAPELVANQLLDFHKQDGITEIEESSQAMLCERRLNDALLEDERNGRVAIGRTPAFVGAVSNFSNFLDLCRKIFRNMELGVPIVVLSRSNTTQHMFRYVVMLLAQLRDNGLDTGLCTYCSCSVEEQRRLLKACPGSPMYFTGSRAVASRIKEVLPRLVASTGGPNTMVIGPGGLKNDVARAACASSLIEHKGQCTAMRHVVLPGATEADVRAIYETAPLLLEGGAVECLQRKEFSAMLKGLEKPLAEGYQELSIGAVSASKASVAFRISEQLPKAINEQWREAYLDVTAPRSLDRSFVDDLSAWLNQEQPISLALNCGLEVAKDLFERTSLVVYTVGNTEQGAPAMTCQARPQDGECFGEFPSRKELQAVTAFPVIIPSSTPGYNTEYTQDFLKAHGKEPLERWGFNKDLDGCKALLRRCKSNEEKGYCHVLFDYLADATTGPHRGCGSRTALFGLQRPPLHGGLTCLRLEKVSGPNLPHMDAVFDQAIRYIFPFMATTAKKQLVVSLDPFLSFPAFPMLQQQGLKVVRESKEAFEAAVGNYWNVVRLPQPSEVTALMPRYPLAAHFVSTLFPMGHVKSTLSDHTEFVTLFAASPKWLRLASGADAATTPNPSSRL